MVKLNLNRVAELEKQNAGNTLYLNTLQMMIDLVMSPQDPMGWSNKSSVALAANTLIDLGILDEDSPVKKTEQINS